MTIITRSSLLLLLAFTFYAPRVFAADPFTPVPCEISAATMLDVCAVSREAGTGKVIVRVREVLRGSRTDLEAIQTPSNSLHEPRSEGLPGEDLRLFLRNVSADGNHTEQAVFVIYQGEVFGVLNSEGKVFGVTNSGDSREMRFPLERLRISSPTP